MKKALQILAGFAAVSVLALAANAEVKGPATVNAGDKITVNVVFAAGGELASQVEISATGASVTGVTGGAGVLVATEDNKTISLIAASAAAGQTVLSIDLTVSGDYTLTVKDVDGTAIGGSASGALAIATEAEEEEEEEELEEEEEGVEQEEEEEETEAPTGNSNPKAGVAIAIIPTIVAAAAAVVSKKK